MDRVYSCHYSLWLGFQNGQAPLSCFSTINSKLAYGSANWRRNLVYMYDDDVTRTSKWHAVLRSTNPIIVVHTIAEAS